MRDPVRKGGVLQRISQGWHGATSLAVALGCAVLGSGSAAQAACIGALDDMDGVVAQLAARGGVGGVGGSGLIDGPTLENAIANGDGIGGTGLEDPTGGVGGTGHRRSMDGIGGTGLVDNGSGNRFDTRFEKEDAFDTRAYEGLDNASLDGIRAAGTNVGAASSDRNLIRGVVTRLSGDCMPGERIELDGSRVIDAQGSERALQDLRVGQVVGIETVAAGATLHAVRVSLDPLLEGPVTATDPLGGVIEVMGQRVEVGRFVPIEGQHGAPLTLPEINPGDSVIVHGMRLKDGSIVATWLARRAASDMARVHGFGKWDQAGAGSTRLSIGGVPVMPHDASPSVHGEWLSAVGHWDSVSASLADARVFEAMHHDSEAGSDELATAERILDVRVHLGRLPPTTTR
jgi:hypothetical protein